MKDIAFITGNQNKADFMAKWLGMPIPHEKLDLDELQSLDLHEIVEHKAKQAYEKLAKPVLVEDVAFTIHALGRLPGPFIKWFLEELGTEQICNLIPKDSDRSATSAVCFCYFDGTEPKFFDGHLNGVLAASPRGERGFGFDPLFIPRGSEKTHAEMDDGEVAQYGLRTTTVFPQLREFLRSLDK